MGRDGKLKAFPAGVKRFIVRVALERLAATITIFIALLGLCGYVPGLQFLGRIREGYIPMAPSTAISFILLAGVLLGLTPKSRPRGVQVLLGALVVMVSLFGALEVAGHFSGRDLNFEDAMVPSAGYLGAIPVARMSPFTGAAFFLAGFAALTLVLRYPGRGWRTHLGHWAGCLGSLTLVISFVFCLAYLYGTPLLYGRGATIPMALTTALSFLMLGTATVFASGKDAIPLRLFVGPSTSGYLLRVFVPLTTLSTLLAGFMVFRVTISAQINPALVAAIAAVLATSIAGFITAWIARRVAGTIAKSEVARDQAMASLYESEERYRAIAEDMPVLVCRFVFGGKITYVNKAYCKVFQKTTEELIGQTFLSLIPETDRETVMAQISSLTVECPTQTIEYQVVAPDGELRWQRWINRALFDGRGQVVAYQAIGEDVTDRRQTHDDLARQRYYLARAQEIGSIGTWELDIKRNELIWTDENYRVFGVPLGTKLTYETFMNCVHPDDRDYVDAKWKAALENEPYDIEHRLLVDGNIRWVREKGEMQFDEEGECIRGTGFTQDITERKNAEQEREKLIAKLEAQNAEMERFTYTVSHDLKSPLITLKGYMGVLREDVAIGDTEEVDRDIMRMSNAADKMTALLDDLLELSRVGRVNSTPEEMAFGDLAHEAIELVSGRAGAAEIQVDVSPELPVVFGDRSRLREVLQNLVENAVKYMGDQPEPSIEIGSREDGGDTVFYVRDNGIGIEPRFHEKVFGLFDQLNPKMEGTGVGLALVKRIVEMRGGRVWIESDGVGHGSTFCFTLPPHPLPDAPEAAD